MTHYKNVSTVERYAVLIRSKNGLVLFSNNNSENHFDTEEECKKYIEVVVSNSNLIVNRIYGEGAIETLQCRKIPCYTNGEAMHTIYTPEEIPELFAI